MAISAKEFVSLFPCINVVKTLICRRLAYETVILVIRAELSFVIERPEEFFTLAAFSAHKTHLIKERYFVVPIRI
jgi:hypothetical protein